MFPFSVGVPERVIASSARTLLVGEVGLGHPSDVVFAENVRVEKRPSRRLDPAEREARADTMLGRFSGVFDLIHFTA